jgi:hypothetical protein
MYTDRPNLEVHLGKTLSLENESGQPAEFGLLRACDAFLLRNELDFEILLAGEEGGILSNLIDLVCSGPYNHVTSLSFSLVVDVSNGVAMPK